MPERRRRSFTFHPSCQAPPRPVLERTVKCRPPEPCRRRSPAARPRRDRHRRRRLGAPIETALHE
eukprot:8088650-Pyramimonas_sp.AAC.1